MSEEKRQQIAAVLAGANVNFSASLRGAQKRDDWECDAWNVVFQRGDSGRGEYIEFDYFTGTGHRNPIKGAPKCAARPRTLAREDWEKRYLRPVAPHAADVLYSIMLDASACEMSFRDWCSEYGYNNDSMKDFATYTACCESGEKLRRFFNHEQREQFRAILEDY